MLDLLRYERADGTVPLEQWLSTLRDRTAQARVRMRITQLGAGNFGDCVSVGEGVMELRIHVGAGYRLYCARYGPAVVLLLCGGDKASQAADIRLAKEYLKLWKRSL
jgi:putative addiction module killer protein